MSLEERAGSVTTFWFHVYPDHIDVDSRLVTCVFGIIGGSCGGSRIGTCVSRKMCGRDRVVALKMWTPSWAFVSLVF